jgi:two-component system, NtrC family, response regulator GlrR
MRIVPAGVQQTLEICARASALGIPLIGKSEAFLGLISVVGRVAQHGDAATLIQGETGTGKELIARTIHYLGRRASFPFVPVNCGALPEALIENELFGHHAGAFTGAGADVSGLIRLADRGTLFLDEIDALPLKAQVGLLRFLQDGHYRPLGAQREEKANLRIIAACNGCLETEIRAGRFRQDLYYRLNLLSIDVPPLRERHGDTTILSQYFLREFARRYSMPNKTLHGATARWFNEYVWPGNVRELENLLHRECLTHEAEELRISEPRAFHEGSRSATVTLAVDTNSQATQYHLAKARALEQFDRAYLSQLLTLAGGNITKAAVLAGKERRALGKMLKRYGISRAQAGADDHIT